MPSIAVSISTSAIRVNGCLNIGDGGAALYKKVASQPAHQGRFQSADGAWWELSDTIFRPEMFYQTGDMNDAPAIQRCIDFVSQVGDVDANGVARGGDITFAGRKYDIGSTTITLPVNVGVRSARGAELLYNGTGVALDVYGSSSLTYSGLIRELPNLTYSPGPVWDAGTDTTSRGLQLSACHHERISFGIVRNFRYGLTLRALANTGVRAGSGDAICNIITFGKILNCWRGIDAIYFPASPPSAMAGVNENTFIFGAIRIDGAFNHEAGSCYIYLPDAENNGNFFRGNLERGGNAKGIYCNSINNEFHCRFENGTVTSYIEFGPQSEDNKVFGRSATGVSTNGAFTTGVADNGYGNMFYWSKVVSSKGFTLNFESGKILFGNLAAAPAVPIQGYGTNRLQIGDANTAGTRHFGYVLQEAYSQTAGTTVAGSKNHINLNYTVATTITGAVNLDSTIDGLVTIFDVAGGNTLKHTPAPTAGAGKFVFKAAADKVTTALTAYLFRQYAGNLYEI